MSKNNLRIGIVLNYLNMGLGSLIPLIYTPIMLSLLGQSEYGLYKLSSSITSYLGLLSMGLGAAVNRYLIKSRVCGGQDAEENMFGLFILIFRGIAILTLICGALLVFNLGRWYANSLSTTEIHRMIILTLLMIANTSLSFSVAPYISIVTAREEYLFHQSINIISTIGMPIANLIALVCGYASIGMATSSLLVNIIIRIAYLIYVNNTLNVHAQYRNLPLKALPEIITFSLWIFIGNIVDQLNNATDILMIGSRPELATVGVAVYSVGSVISGMAVSITAGISAILMPRTTKLVFEKTSFRELTNFAIKIGRIQVYLISTICACFFLFGQPFLYYYVGNEYSASYWVALFVLVPLSIPLAQSVCINILVAKNQHKYRSMTLLLIAIINVVGTWIILPHWGILGAALMTGGSLIIGNGVIMNIVYAKKRIINLHYFWKEILKCYLVPIIISILGYFLLSFIDLYNITTLVFSFVLFICTIFLLQFKLVFNEYEKSLIWSLLNKRNSRENHKKS